MLIESVFNENHSYRYYETLSCRKFSFKQVINGILW